MKKSVERVVSIAEYSRLMILFDAPDIGEKTLLAKFAKLTKISWRPVFLHSSSCPQQLSGSADKKSVEWVIPIAGDCRLVPLFDASYIGEKTLLAKFAKLTKISWRPVFLHSSSCPQQLSGSAEKKSVERVVPIAGDCRLVILFDAPDIGEKTLLAKFAKLTKISWRPVFLRSPVLPGAAFVFGRKKSS